MAIPRREQIDNENGGYYHLISRCVRRAFLCGKDPETGKDFDHRRKWIEDRILALAKVFAIEVYAYAVMHNHYHLVVYCDPKAPVAWSDMEVAERWLKVFPGKLNDPKFATQRNLRLQAIVSDQELLAKYRRRLGNLSWLMRRINEPLAKQSNAEDFCKGHFWESRFTSQALLDEAAALTCMAYVDLNPIRAGLTDNIEKSEHTGIKRRIENLKPQQLKATVKSIAGEVKNRTMTLKLEDYISLVEWTGKTIAYQDKHQIPKSLSCVFERLNLNQEHWVNQVEAYGCSYYRAVGCLDKLKHKAEQLEQQWLKGINQIKKLYLSSS
jgi:putative transposase